MSVAALVALLSLFLAFPVKAEERTWYDSEVVHNAVHDLEEKMATWSRRLDATDRAPLRRAIADFEGAVGHMHDQMHHPEQGDADAKRTLRAFRRLRAPLQRLVLEVRRAQLRARKGEPYRDELFEVLDIYVRLQFYMTPVFLNNRS